MSLAGICISLAVRSMSSFGGRLPDCRYSENLRRRRLNRFLPILCCELGFWGWLVCDLFGGGVLLLGGCLDDGSPEVVEAGCAVTLFAALDVDVTGFLIGFGLGTDPGDVVGVGCAVTIFAAFELDGTGFLMGVGLGTDPGNVVGAGCPATVSPTLGAGSTDFLMSFGLGTESVIGAKNLVGFW